MTNYRGVGRGLYQDWEGIFKLRPENKKEQSQPCRKSWMNIPGRGNYTKARGRQKLRVFKGQK